MFTQADALSIRRGLGELDFSRPLADSLAPLFQDYFSFYSFDDAIIAGSTFHTAGVLRVDEFEVVAQYFRSPHQNSQGTVVLLHGYFDHVGIYQHIISHCLSRKLDVVIFDMPGHGLSSGKAASIKSFRQYADVFLSILDEMEKGELAGPWSLLGQSTGAAVIIDCLLKNRLDPRFPIREYIALAPLLRPFAWRSSRFLFLLSRPFLVSSKRKFSQNSHDKQFLDFLKLQDPLQSRKLSRDWVLAMIEYQKDFARAASNTTPLWIIQGTDDTTVDWKYNLQKFESKFPNAKIEKVPDARHHLVNESEIFRKQVFSLIDSALNRSGNSG